MPRDEDDFCAWIDHTVSLLRAGQWEEVDTEHVRLLLEKLMQQEHGLFLGYLVNLLAAMLRLGRRPGVRRLEYDVRIQRGKLVWLLGQSPSLRNLIEPELEKAYWAALATVAAGDSSVCEYDFSWRCRYSVEEILGDEDPDTSLYQSAALMAARDMEMDVRLLPENCPYTQEQVLDEEFFPEDVPEEGTRH